MRYRHGISGSQYAGECGDSTMELENDEFRSLVRKIEEGAKPLHYRETEGGAKRGDILSCEEGVDGSFEWTVIVDANPGEDWKDAEEGEDNGNGRFLLVDGEGKRYLAVTWYLTPEEE